MTDSASSTDENDQNGTINTRAAEIAEELSDQDVDSTQIEQELKELLEYALPIDEARNLIIKKHRAEIQEDGAECYCPEDIEHTLPPWKGGPLVEKTDYCDPCKKRIQQEYDRLDGMCDAIHDRLVARGKR